MDVRRKPRVPTLRAAEFIVERLASPLGELLLVSDGEQLRALDFADCRARNRVQRQLMAEAIGRLGNKGLRALPSEANFILVTCPERGPLTAEALYNGLALRGFITRWLPGQGLPHALRISVGTEEETAGVIAALNAIADAA